MDKIIKIFIAVFAVIAVAAGAVVFVSSPATPQTASVITVGEDNTVYFFYGEECPHCKNVEPFIDNLSKKYPDVDIQRLEIWHNQTNQQIYAAVNTAAGASTSGGVPEVVVGNVVLVGEVQIPAQLEAYVQAIEEKKKVNSAQ